MRPSEHNRLKRSFEWNLLVINKFFRVISGKQMDQDVFDTLCEAARNVYGSATLRSVTRLLYRIRAECTDPWYFIEGDSGSADFYKLQMLTGPYWQTMLKMMDIKNGHVPETSVRPDDCPTDEGNPEITT